MALATDQQAMLQLVLERGQSYADLASVLGVDEAEVRSRARAALTELAGADPDRNVGLTDYLLGQADPIGRADAVRHLKDDPGDLALAAELSQKLLLIAPQADLPRLPGEDRRARSRRAPRGAIRLPIPTRLGRVSPPPPPAGEVSATRRTTLSRRQAQLIVVFGCAAVLAVVAILAATGTFSGGGGGSPTTSATTASNQPLATVALRAPGGGSAKGSALFGTNGSQLYSDLKLRGLKPPPKGQAYVLWFLLSGNRGFPVPAVLSIGQNGTLQQRITIPSGEIPIAQRAQALDVSLAQATAIESAIKSAFKQKRLVQEPGTVVLRGTIPASGTSSGGGTPKG